MSGKKLRLLFFIFTFSLEVGFAAKLIGNWQPIQVQAATPLCLQTYLNNDAKIFSSKSTFVTYMDCMLDNSGMQARHTQTSTLLKSEELSFGTNHVMSAYLDLYELTGNDKYLQRFTEIMDKLLTLTDLRLGYKVVSGESFPAWSRNSYQTYSYPKVLNDQNNQPSLEIRAENWAFNELFDITVSDGTNANTFKLDITNHYPRAPLYNQHAIFDNLTMNDFANERAMGYLKIRKLGSQRPKNINIPKLETKRHINTHNSGNIAELLARYAYLSPGMSSQYKSKADSYKQAAVDALYVHDTIGEWVDKGDYGYYVWNTKGAFWADGYVQPYNYTAAMGAAFSYLYRGSQGIEKEKYRIRLDKLAKGFMYCPPGAHQSQTGGTECMTYIVNGNKYSWPYGYLNSFEKYNMPVETLSYGPLDLDFIYLLTEDGFLSSQDSVRFANTVYGMLSPADQNPPALAANMLGAQLGTYTVADGFGQMVKAPWGMVPFAKYRKDIFTKTAALYAGLPLSKYYNSMSGYSRYYSAMTQTAITAEKNGYWSGNNVPTSTPTTAPTMTPTPSIKPTSAATPTLLPTNLPTPTATVTPTPTMTPSLLSTNTPQPTATPGVCSKSTDFNKDGITDLGDASYIIAALGKSGDNLPEDLNCEGLVDLSDFSILIQKLGT